MKHQLPPLPYDYAALEPHIDARTMQLHHDKHHAAYVEKLNAALEKYPDLQQRSAAWLLMNLDEVPQAARTAVRNNAGGHVNHTMYWRAMAPKGGGAPRGALADAITRDFGSFAKFKSQFDEAGEKLFGSGWVWLARAKDGGKLVILTTQGHDNPIMQGQFPDSRQRCVGARLLPEAPEPAAGISRRLVAGRELAGGGAPLRALGEDRRARVGGRRRRASRRVGDWRCERGYRKNGVTELCREFPTHAAPGGGSFFSARARAENADHHKKKEAGQGGEGARPPPGREREGAENTKKKKKKNNMHFPPPPKRRGGRGRKKKAEKPKKHPRPRPDPGKTQKAKTQGPAPPGPKAPGGGGAGVAPPRTPPPAPKPRGEGGEGKGKGPV